MFIFLREQVHRAALRNRAVIADTRAMHERINRTRRNRRIGHRKVTQSDSPESKR